MAVTCKRLCRERCFAHPMRPDDLRSRDLRLSSQPTEDRPHRDPRPATRSPESHDPKEAGDQGANRQRQVTTQPEFRRGPRGKSPEGWKSRGKGRRPFQDGRRKWGGSCWKHASTRTCWKDDLRSRDLRLSSQPTEDQPHRDPRPATRSPESHDPKEAEDRGANRERQVTTQPEFRRGPRGKSPRGLKSRGKGRKALSHGRLADNGGCTSE